jgi:hypothetical protein
MKEYRDIEDLLGCYYNALITEAEEQWLKDFFCNEDVPPHLQKEKEMFLQLQNIQIPKGLEERLSKQIDQWATQERFVQKNPRRRTLQWIGSIAASLLILFSIGWYFHAPQPRKDTCATPEEAYIHTEKALMMFAQALNKGVKLMEVIQESTEKVERNIQKQLNKLND